jgi:hypothetical protein
MHPTYDTPLPRLVISGGQTGADRAGLDWAIARGLEHGGWCPRGRLASDGVIPERYKWTETESDGYRQRTKRNVQDSDATLLFNIGELDGGTLQTLRFTLRLNKPCLVCQLDTLVTEGLAAQLTDWLCTVKPGILNVAGPREEKRPGVYLAALKVLEMPLRKDRAATCRSDWV